MSVFTGGAGALCVKVHTLRGKLSRRVVVGQYAGHAAVATFNARTDKLTNRWFVGVDVVLDNRHGTAENSDTFTLLEVKTQKRMLFVRDSSETRSAFVELLVALRDAARVNAAERSQSLHAKSAAEQPAWAQLSSTEGWLYKKGAKAKGLKKRFCVVTKGSATLVYFRSAAKRKKHGEIDLGAATALVEGHHGQFTIATPGRCYEFHVSPPKRASHGDFATSKNWLAVLSAESGIVPRGNVNSPSGFPVLTMKEVSAGAAAAARAKLQRGDADAAAAGGGDASSLSVPPRPRRKSALARAEESVRPERLAAALERAAAAHLATAAAGAAAAAATSANMRQRVAFALRGGEWKCLSCCAINSSRRACLACGAAYVLPAPELRAPDAAGGDTALEREGSDRLTSGSLSILHRRRSAGVETVAEEVTATAREDLAVRVARAGEEEEEEEEKEAPRAATMAPPPPTPVGTGVVRSFLVSRSSRVLSTDGIDAVAADAADAEAVANGDAERSSRSRPGSVVVQSVLGGAAEALAKLPAPDDAAAHFERRADKLAQAPEGVTAGADGGARSANVAAVERAEAPAREGGAVLLQQAGEAIVRKRRNGVSRGLSIVEDLDLDDLASPPPPEAPLVAGASSTARTAAAAPLAGAAAESPVQAPVGVEIDGPVDASADAPTDAPAVDPAASARAPDDCLIAAAPLSSSHDADPGGVGGAGTTTSDATGKLPSSVLDVAMAAPARVRKASVTLRQSAVGRLPRKLERVPRRASSRGVTPPLTADDIARSSRRRSRPAIIATSSSQRIAEETALGVLEAIDAPQRDAADTVPPMRSPRPPPRDGEALRRPSSVREHAARIELQLLTQSAAAAHHRTIRARRAALATKH
jgi:hypothetical protein